MFDWFSWRAREPETKAKRSKKSKAIEKSKAINSSDFTTFLLAESAKNSDRAPQKGEIYLRLYPEKVKEVYDMDPPQNTNAGVRLNALKAIAQKLYEQDTPEVQKEVADVIIKWYQDKADNVNNLQDVEREPTPEEMQR